MQSWVNSNLSHAPALSLSLSPPRSFFHSFSPAFPPLPQPPQRSHTRAVSLPIFLSLSPVPLYLLSYLFLSSLSRSLAPSLSVRTFAELISTEAMAVYCACVFLPHLFM